MTDCEHEEPRGKPIVIGDLLDGVLARIGGGRRPPLLEIRERWNDIAGSQWKDRARPVRGTDELLIVEVIDGATASVLRFELAHLERRLAELAPGSGAKKMRLRVAVRPWPSDRG